MRKLFLSALLASLTAVFVGCDSAPAPSADPAADGPALPGAPTSGPEALKTKAKKG